MKSFIVICLLGVAALAAAGKTGQYTDRYDNINLDEILDNRRLLKPYVLCALEQARCSPEGKELKSHIKDALETNCSQCTDAQKRGARRVIGHLINNEPQFWEQLTKKYDPQHQYTRQYEQDLRTVRH